MPRRVPFAETDRPAARHDRRSGGPLRATTVLAVRCGGKVALGADGQVTLGDAVVKHTASKVRTLAGGRVLGGFAGSAADGLALFELLEAKLSAVGGNFVRACVDLAKDWRQDRRYRRLEALMIVADAERTFLLSGTGDVIEPEDGIAAVGSGGNYALAAARALRAHTDYPAEKVVEEALAIAADICVYTNHRRTILTLPGGAS